MILTWVESVAADSGTPTEAKTALPGLNKLINIYQGVRWNELAKR